jgi:CheY-like chemotaxis protein
MPKRALIAEPDPDEANRQAAILKDDGYETRTFVEGDLVAELERNAPDILVLRHERPGSQTGLALVSRLKQVAAGTAIVITTSDLTPDAIEKNRRQKVHADGYLRLPVERNELVQAARAVPQVEEAGDVAKEETAPRTASARRRCRPRACARSRSCRRRHRAGRARRC